MVKDTDNVFAYIHASYIDAEGYPQSESFDEEELNELVIDMNTIIEEYRKAGVQSLMLDIRFSNGKAFD